MNDASGSSRRELVRIGATGGLLLVSNVLLAGTTLPVLAQEQKDQQKGLGEKLREMVTGSEKEVTPPEDLMREHGVLDRVLLVYEAGMRKFAANQDFDPVVLTDSATIIRDFIHNYHEKSEEQHVFPRLKQAGKLPDLIDMLVQQHDAGRRVTETILHVAPSSNRSNDDRRRLVSAMQSFITMYRPHAAREDTEVFPLIKDVVSSHEYDAMAEDFEKQEHHLFGEDGFEKMVQRVAKLEQTIGIYDLKQFTPA